MPDDFSNVYTKEQSLEYIKQNFTTRQQIDDYIDILRKMHSGGQLNIQARGNAYKVYVDASGYRFLPEDYSIPETNYWTSHDPPVMSKIIVADSTDPTWKALRVKAISAGIAENYQGIVANNKDILDYLRRFYDSNLPDNINVDDPLTEKSWKKYYSNDQLGVGTLGEGESLFGNWSSLGVYIDYVAFKLQSFNISTKQLSPDNSASQSQASYDLDQDYGQRIAILEQFLEVAGAPRSPIYSNISASLYNTYAAKNNRELYDPNLSNQDSFSIFQKILAPVKEQNIADASAKFQETIFSKIEHSGLLDLLVYADQIRQFGRDRLRKEETVKASAGLIVNRR